MLSVNLPAARVRDFNSQKFQRENTVQIFCHSKRVVKWKTLYRAELMGGIFPRTNNARVLLRFDASGFADRLWHRRQRTFIVEINGRCYTRLRDITSNGSTTCYLLFLHCSQSSRTSCSTFPSQCKKKKISLFRTLLLFTRGGNSLPKIRFVHASSMTTTLMFQIWVFTRAHCICVQTTTKTKLHSF